MLKEAPRDHSDGLTVTVRAKLFQRNKRTAICTNSSMLENLALYGMIANPASYICVVHVCYWYPHSSNLYCSNVGGWNNGHY